MKPQINKQAARPVAGDTATVSVSAEIDRLKNAPEYNVGDRHTVSLVKDEGLNVMLMVLKKGARLHEHRAKGPVAIHVVSGSVILTAESKQHQISSNELLALGREIPHSLEALEESALILVTSITHTVFLNLADGF